MEQAKAPQRRALAGSFTNLRGRTRTVRAGWRPAARSRGNAGRDACATIINPFLDKFEARFIVDNATLPSHAFHGYLACLINRQGGSDCETLALGFKRFQLGPLIGTRTWGGWVGIRGDKPLRDKGMITQPEFGGWDPRGKDWIMEGHGVDPDAQLDLDPDGLIPGHDVQLDYAIEQLVQEIGQDARDLPKPPPIRPRALEPVR